MGVPDTETMTVDASFSMQPRLGSGVTLNLVVEDRDATNRTGVSFMGHFGLGAEIGFHDRVFLRAGWAGGYISGGLGLKRPGAEMSLTYYSEEIGPGYLAKSDPRYLLQYTLRTF